MNSACIPLCMSNKSILLSLVACVEFSYYISVTISPPIILLKNLCGDVGLSSNIKQTKFYFIGARLQECSGLDMGVELERFHSNSFKKYNKNNAYIV